VSGPPDIAIVGIAGAGTMGAGFAQVAIEAGREVVLYDVDQEAVDRARGRVRDGLRRRRRHNEPELDDASLERFVEARSASLRTATTLVELAVEADLVIEAALEDLDLKQTIFAALDAEADPAVILATNTSALSVTAIASATERPGRVIGLHGFNPLPLMALIEVVATTRSDPAVVARAETEMRAWGKTAIVVRDTPGFIVNRVNRPFTIAALRLLEAGAASVQDIDAAMRQAGYPMGPFELMDLTGLDVNLAATTAVWTGLGRPDRLRPSVLQERLVAAGHLGRKTGRGFYRYGPDGERGEPALATEPVGTQTTREANSLTATEIQHTISAAIADEARRAVADGVATEPEIDLAMRLGANHPRGPLESQPA
jgi:3-hydroxybutyryl-CoA dehydrogenase